MTSCSLRESDFINIHHEMLHMKSSVFYKSVDKELRCICVNAEAPVYGRRISNFYLNHYTCKAGFMCTTWCGVCHKDSSQQRILKASSATLWKQVMLWAALQTKSMVEVGLHTGKVGSLVQRCTMVGDMTKETGNCDMGLTCDIRKPQWKCPCLMILIGEVLMCSFSKAACPLCCAHCKEQSVKTWVGSGRQVVAWHYWKLWLLEEVRVTGFLWQGSRTENTMQPTDIVPDEVEILEGFCEQNMSSSFCFFLLVFSSILCLSCPCVDNYDAMWKTTWPHWASAHIVGKEGWDGGPEQQEKLLPLNFKLLNTLSFLNHIRILCAFSQFPTEPMAFQKLLFVALQTKSADCYEEAHFVSVIPHSFPSASRLGLSL